MNEYRAELKAALERFNGKLRNDVVQDVARILKVAQQLGYDKSSRAMYGGGTEVNIHEAKVGYIVAQVMCYDERVHVVYPEPQFFDEPTFQFPNLPPYNPELDAELRNEEALYGYELQRPWVLYQ